MDDVTMSIGELARRCGVPVRTVRFYCDEGVLQSLRSAGGHRRFDASAVERLTLVRRLRALGLGLRAVVEVLAGERSVAEAAAQERAALDVSLAALAWRRASLRALEGVASTEERAARLELLAAASDGATARSTLEGFWRLAFAPTVVADDLGMFLAVGVPRPPTDPSPEQVVAYAGMVGVVSEPVLRERAFRRRRADAVAAYQHTVLRGEIGVLCDAVRAGARPAGLLDAYVRVHASARGEKDTPSFRRELAGAAALDRSAGMRRYWRHVRSVTGEHLTVGEAHFLLLDALDGSAGSGAVSTTTS
ncbi:MerR family transcriptional regulator [Streptomyces formicae]|uniref:Putative MerR-family transcriptional regulator n=1 Tax=Streptomyces formicae TaxID=1616117 RepID=A0A291Q0P9_9ACTN|nr:MerR family transcriptional regulator [Streptomyces formicae]ATL25152.1 putative MerR-family transcriptional regulator [Streptomyces formicae]